MPDKAADDLHPVGPERRSRENGNGHNLTDLLEESARQHPGEIALVEPAAGGHTRSLTYRQLAASAISVARELRGYGVRRGDVVAVWLPNCLEWLVVEFAAARLGAVVLGVNTRFGAHELSHLLGTAQPACVLAPASFLGIDFAGTLRSAAGQLRQDSPGWQSPTVILTGAGDDAGWDASWRAARLATLEGATPPELTDAEAAAGQSPDWVNLFTTSGSTSAPKLAAHDQASLAQHSYNAARAFGLHAGDRLMCILPLCGVFGLNGALAALAVGAACVVEPVFQAANALNHMSEYRITHLNGGDDLFLRIIEAYERQPADLSSWRRGGIANFTGKADFVVRWAEEHIGAKLAGVYGSSECFALMATWNPRLPARERLKAGGEVVSPAAEVRVASEQTGQVLPSGEPGELQFRGYNVFPCYYRNTSATESAFTQDGWFRSGDLGYLQEQGTFVYLCRAGDALRLHGFLVEPLEIENFLMLHPAVDTARLVAAAGPDGNEVLVAFVKLSAGTTVSPGELIGFCHGNLASYKIPAHVIPVEAFPVTAGTNGDKIVTSELRELAVRFLGDAGVHEAASPTAPAPGPVGPEERL